MVASTAPLLSRYSLTPRPVRRSGWRATRSHGLWFGASRGPRRRGVARACGPPRLRGGDRSRRSPASVLIGQRTAGIKVRRADEGVVVHRPVVAVRMAWSGDLLVPDVRRVGFNDKPGLFVQTPSQCRQRQIHRFDAVTWGRSDDRCASGYSWLREAEAAQQDIVIIGQDDRPDGTPITDSGHLPLRSYGSSVPGGTGRGGGHRPLSSQPNEERATEYRFASFWRPCHGVACGCRRPGTRGCRSESKLPWE
jgi:hypothetical protein